MKSNVSIFEKKNQTSYKFIERMMITFRVSFSVSVSVYHHQSVSVSLSLCACPYVVVHVRFWLVLSSKRSRSSSGQRAAGKVETWQKREKSWRSKGRIDGSKSWGAERSSKNAETLSYICGFLPQHFYYREAPPPQAVWST